MMLLGLLRDSLARFAAKRRTVFDPSLFGDPLAERIDWSPLRAGGANLRTHSLREIDGDRLELVPTFGARAFGILFALVGLSSVLYGLAGLRTHGADLPHILLVSFGIPFGAVGAWALQRMTGKHVLDRREGSWWKGDTPPSQDPSLEQRGEAGALSGIHAVQLVTEWIRRDKGHSYFSTEINLVFHDGSRHNLVDHGHESIQQDARRLAAFLEVPLWRQADAQRPITPS